MWEFHKHNSDSELHGEEPRPRNKGQNEQWSAILPRVGTAVHSGESSECPSPDGVATDLPRGHQHQPDLLQHGLGRVGRRTEDLRQPCPGHSAQCTRQSTRQPRQSQFIPRTDESVQD